MKIFSGVLLVVLGMFGLSEAQNILEVRAVRIEEGPKIDGLVDEKFWFDVPAAKDFIQQNPDFGVSANQQTEVRFVFNGETLFIGVICFDERPQEIVVSQARRDGSLGEDDSIQIILDTFKDQQNGYIFGTNPSGVQYDGQVTKEGRSGGFSSPVSGGGGFGQNLPIGGAIGGFNLNWNGVWEVRSQVTPRGWEAEIAIPFSTLRFGKQETWGLNIFRIVRRQNEYSFWSSIPRSFNIYKVSLAGNLKGMDIPRQSSLDLMPYLLAGASKTAGSNGRRITEVGLDAKYAITPSLSLDMTYNTDFAQVEVDDVQVNLSRFALFFPEKRSFFLENAGFFQFGTPETVETFFSRRIGLGEDTSGDLQPVPILGGARLTGKIGRYSLGVLDMQTEKGQGVVRANNFFVSRINRELGTRSTIGAIFTNRQATSAGTEKDFGRTVGIDANIGFGRDITLFSYAAKSSSPNVSGSDLAGRVLLDYNTDLWVFQGGYTEVQDNFNPDMGFVRRDGYRHTEFEVHFTPYPKNSYIRRFDPHISWNRFYDMDNNLETEFLHLDYAVRFENGGRAGVYLNHREEVVSKPFKIAPNIVIPTGHYFWNEANARWYTDPSARLFTTLSYTHGGFYGGKRNQYKITGGLRTSEKFLMEIRYQLNDAMTSGGAFRAHLAQIKINYSFTPLKFIQGLIQYNSNDQTFSSNVRISLLKQNNSGLFVVYNDMRNTLQGDFISEDRVFMIKYTHLLRF